MPNNGGFTNSKCVGSHQYVNHSVDNIAKKYHSNVTVLTNIYNNNYISVVHQTSKALTELQANGCYTTKAVGVGCIFFLCLCNKRQLCYS